MKPSPPTAPLVYVTPGVVQDITVQMINHPEPAPRTVISVAVDGEVQRLAVVAGGPRTARHPARLILRNILADLAPPRRSLVTVNTAATGQAVNHAATAVLGHTLRTIVVRNTTGHSHPFLGRWAHHQARLTGTTANGTRWKVVAENDLPAQVVIHSDASLRAALGCGWVIESVRLAEPMHGTRRMERDDIPQDTQHVLYGELLAIQCAVQDALEVFPRAGMRNSRPLYVYTDSSQAAQYLRAREKPIGRPSAMGAVWDWYTETSRQRPAMKVYWIRGHNGHAPNENADRLARSVSA